MTALGPGPVRTPVWRHVPKVLTVARNVTAAAPSSTPWALGTVWLEQVLLRIPRGHAGLTGLAIIDAGQRILPYSDAVDWIIADGFTEPFPIQMQVSPALTLLAFNTDTVYTHKFYLLAQVRNIELGALAPPIAATPVI